MAALPIKITPAGYAALRNAQGNGTNAVIVAVAGLTSTAFAPGDAVPAEIKRVATIAGGATSANTIHVTISDTGTDAYPLRGFGLYLTDGTLLGSYGQAGVIVEKSAQAAMLLAVDIQFADIDATQITFGDTNFSNPQATTERLGVVELATDDETAAGTDSTRAITPKSLLAALNARLGVGAPSAFVKTLLAAATAIAFRVALGIKSAATFDTGQGNGLDADKLDGQDGSYYQAWANLTGVPAAFPPAGHTHTASDITSGTFPVARGGTGLATVPTGNFLTGAVNGTDPLVPRTPAQVLADIGAAAKSHSHVVADVTGLQDALDGKASKVHTHDIADVNGLPTALNAKAPVVAPVFQQNVQSQYPALANPAGSGAETWNMELLSNTNRDRVRWTTWRSIAGPGWNTNFWRLSRVVDSTEQAYLDFGGASANLGFLMRFGYGANSFAYVDTSSTWVFQQLTNHVGAAFFQAQDNTFVSSAPFRFTGMGANATMYWHGTNGSGDDMCAITRQGVSSYWLNWNGSITASGGFQWSDKRLKSDIRPKDITRGLALKLARAYCSWTLDASGQYGQGIVAQVAQRFAPAHVSAGKYAVSGKRAVRRLRVDMPGLALEAACDNALAIEELVKVNRALVRRIEKLERKVS